ncbi:MAG: hypothetical protein QXF82_08310 [Nitrososphaeria archaeon]
MNVPKGFSLEENEKPIWYGRMSWKTNWFLLLLAIFTVWPFGIGVIFLIICFLRVISTKRIFVRYGLFKKLFGKLEMSGFLVT